MKSIDIDRDRMTSRTPTHLEGGGECEDLLLHLG